MIRVTCPGCGDRLILKDTMGGKRLHCPECDRVLRVPDLAEAPMVAHHPQAPTSSSAATEPISDVLPTGPHPQNTSASQGSAWHVRLHGRLFGSSCRTVFPFLHGPGRFFFNRTTSIETARAPSTQREELPTTKAADSKPPINAQNLRQQNRVELEANALAELDALHRQFGRSPEDFAARFGAPAVQEIKGETLWLTYRPANIQAVFANDKGQWVLCYLFEADEDKKAAPQDALARLTANAATISGGHAFPGHVHVKGYTRKDGTVVRPNDRAAPGSGGGRRR
jgi:hypothetical protein